MLLIGTRRAPPLDTTDRDQEETREWLDSLAFVLCSDGVERASFLLGRLSARMTKTGARLSYTITTPYRNTIPSSREAFMGGICSWSGASAR